MNKTKKYLSRFSIALLFILGIFYLLVRNKFFGISEGNANLIIGLLGGIFILGSIIIAPGLNKNPENFVGRFMIMTTVQMLSVLSIVAALAYTKYPEAKSFGFHLLGVFCTLLAIQSVLLITINSKKA